MAPDPTPSSLASLHKNLPIVNLSEQDIGEGWSKPSHNVVIRSYWQCYYFAPRPGWRLTSFFTSEGQLHDGCSNYRVPASFRAWLTVLPALIAKVWHRYVVNRGRIY